MDDTTFIREFEDGSLPVDRWDYRAFVKVAYLYLYLLRHTLGDAIDKMRAGVLRRDP